MILKQFYFYSSLLSLFLITTFVANSQNVEINWPLTTEQSVALRLSKRMETISFETLSMIENTDFVNIMDFYHQTPLFYAAYNNKDARVTKWLIEKGADIEKRTIEGITPLNAAARLNGNIDVTRILLENGANPNVHTVTGRSLLYDVLQETYPRIVSPEIIELLLQYKADPNIKNLGTGHTPLYHTIIKQENPKFTKLLLQYGGNLLDKNGQTVEDFLYSHMNNLHEASILKTLIDSGMNIAQMDKKTGKNLLDLAMKTNKNASIIKILLENGANVKDKNVKLALIDLIENKGNIIVIKLLFDHHVKLNSQTLNQLFLSTLAKMIAGKQPNYHVLLTKRLKILLENGANPNKIIDFNSQKHSATSLLIAHCDHEIFAQHDYLPLFELLQTYGANFSEKQTKTHKECLMQVQKNNT